MKLKLLSLLASLVFAGTLMTPALTGTSSANQNISIEFPVAPSAAGQYNWVDTWLAARSEGRLHLGVDLFGPKMTPVVAVESGHITWGRYKNNMPKGGNFIEITGNSGRRYYYTHLNNDTPGTNDGQATCTQVFPAKICQHISQPTGEIRTEIPVSAGEFIGYNGDSGNAEGTPPHIHFEILVPNGNNTGNGDIYDIEVRNDDWDEINPTPIIDAAYDRLVSNFSPVAFIQDHSSEEAQLIRLYATFFGRAPEDKGYNYWLQQLANGSTIAEISTYFEASTEFSIRFSNVSDAEYVEFLYNEILDRNSDSRGQRYWLGELAGNRLERSNIVLYFAQSEELSTKLRFRTEAIKAYYYYLGRVPTAQELNDWRTIRSTLDPAQALQSVFD